MLKVLDPIRIKDSMLLYSSITENDCPEWVPGATYAAQASAAGQLSDYVNLAGANPFNGLTEWYSSNGVPVVVNAAGNGGHGELRTTARDTLAGTSGWSPGSGSFVVYPGELLHIACDIDSSGSALAGAVGVMVLDDNDRIIGWLGAGYSPGMAYHRIAGSVTMPGSAARASIWLQIDGSHGVQHPAVGFSRLYVGRTPETVFGPFVMRSSRHEVYQRVDDGISLLPPESDPDHWIRVGLTNRWAMFDSNVNTRSVGGEDGLQVKLRPGMCNGVALLNLVDIRDMTIVCRYPSAGQPDSDTTRDYAQGITLRTVVAGGEVQMIYQVNLERRNVSDWKSFFVEPYEIRADVFFGFQSRSDVTIEISVPGGNPQVGALIVGNFVELGQVQLGIRAGVDDYNRYDTNQFAETSITQIGFLKTSSYSIVVPRWAINRAHSTLTSVMGRQTVFIASDDYQLAPTTVFGRCKNFEMTLDLPTEAIFTVETQGVTL